MSDLALTFDQRPVEFSGGMKTARSATLGRSLVAVDDWRFVVGRRLNRLIRLPTGWDGYQSGAVSRAVAQFTEGLLNSVMGPSTPTPSLVPVSGGGVQIEWHAGGIDIELYVPRPMKAEIYVSYADARPDLEAELTSDFSLLSEALATMN